MLRKGWDVGRGSFEWGLDWVGTVDMDTAFLPFQDIIVEQAERHVLTLPAFEGIAIDRLDYSEFFNYEADDGVSWIPVNGSGALHLLAANTTATTWGPARALRLSNRQTFNRLHEVLHEQQPPGILGPLQRP